MVSFPRVGKPITLVFFDHRNKDQWPVPELLLPAWNSFSTVDIPFVVRNCLRFFFFSAIWKLGSERNLTLGFLFFFPTVNWNTSCLFSLVFKNSTFRLFSRKNRSQNAVEQRDVFWSRTKNSDKQLRLNRRRIPYCAQPRVYDNLEFVYPRRWAEITTLHTYTSFTNRDHKSCEACMVNITLWT